jgi:hypothetical protein
MLQDLEDRERLIEILKRIVNTSRGGDANAAENLAHL